MARNQVLPVYHQIEITDIASDGMGVGRHEGMVVFVEQTVPGDVVDVQITRKKSGYRKGNPILFHQKSSLRSEPVCHHYGVCGGCKWQNLHYSHQLAYKQKWVEDALSRIGKVTYPSIRPIIASDQAYHYRNKLEYTFSDSGWLTDEEIKSGKTFQRNALGFHIPGRFDKVLDIQTCHLQADPGNAIRLFIRNYALTNHLSFFNLYKQTGLLRTLILRNNQQGEWMVCLCVTEFNPQVAELLDALSEQFPEIKSLLYAINTKRNDTLEGLEVQTYMGTPYIIDEIEGLKFRIGPKSFYQTNPVQAHTLYKIAREFAGIQKGDIVYDLYSGIGTIALFVSSLAQKVIGVEYVDDAVHDARENALLNRIENASFIAGDMQKILVSDFFGQQGHPDVIITDPPRAGMHEEVTRRLRDSGASRIVYVSCNPATQARDLSILDTNYQIQAVQPVDMFPQTTHVENVVLLERRSF